MQIVTAHAVREAVELGCDHNDDDIFNITNNNKLMYYKYSS